MVYGFKQQNAFTLADVLITLAIIGVVASLTIPNLVNNFEKQASQKALLKFYSSMMNASNLFMTENNQDFKSSGLFETQDPSLFGTEFFKKYFVVQKECPNSVSGCFPQVAYRYINGNHWQPLYGASSYKGILNDGTLVRIWVPSGNCVTYCAEIIVDVNGHKSPNQVGRDTFLFWVIENKIIPHSSNDITTTGYGVAKRIILGQDYD